VKWSGRLSVNSAIIPSPSKAETPYRIPAAVSTPEIYGRKVVRSLGVVTTEQVVGFKISGSLDVSKFNGGMALSLADKLIKGREWAMRTITDDALAMGANGLVGIDIRYESLGVKEEVLMVLVYAKGTAVIVE